MRQEYFEAIKLVERLHRRFLEVMKAENDSRGTEDMNNIQAHIFYNIGEGELTNRGYYLGSNVSFNVRKLVENQYLSQEWLTPDQSAAVGKGIGVLLADSQHV
jgi:hypothetical protein